MQNIYFDNAATTKVDDEVVSAISKAMTCNYGNPSSLHKMGVDAQLAFEKAGREVLKAMGGKNGKLIFTSGGTESNNLAIMGGAHALSKRGKRVITTKIEHSSVLNPFLQLEKEGFEVIYLSPDNYGRISAEELKANLTQDTILVSCMLVNNEVGTIQPIKEFCKLTRQLSPLALFHCDAIQAMGKIPFDLKDLNVDLLSISGHKINCSKGIGALYIKEHVNIKPYLYGGDQQYSLKPGTENVPLAIGLGVAAKNARANLSENMKNAQLIKDAIIEKLKSIEEIKILSPSDGCSPWILALSIEGFKSETVLHFLEEKGIYVSSGSACSKGKTSHVLKSMNIPLKYSQSSLRISIGKYNNISDAQQLYSALEEAKNVLRKIRQKN